jgi:hypothetical protein
MRRLVLAAALVLLAVPAVSQADFRTDNYWMATAPYAQRKLVGGYRIRGEGTGYRWQRVVFAKCKGDSSGTFPIDRAHGYYHHLRCGVVLANRGVFTLDYWAIGETNYRVTSIQYVPTA